MPSTPGGLVWPDSTAVPNVPADLQELAESVETGLTRITTGFAIAGGWSLTSFAAKRVGGLCWLRVIANRTGAAIDVSAVDITTGSFVGVLVGTMPSGYIPVFTCGLTHGGTGRASFGYIDSVGGVYVQSVVTNSGADTNLVTGTNISLGGMFPLAA